MITAEFIGPPMAAVFKVPVTFGRNKIYQDFILDTGFSGDLKVHPDAARELGIENMNTIYINNANGEHVLGNYVRGSVDLDGRERPVTIIVAEGPQLLGLNLLGIFGYKAVIDCRHWECHLELA